MVGRSVALDWILTGRSITAKEAHHYGFVNRFISSSSSSKNTAHVETLQAAKDLAMIIAEHPQRTMSCDRRSVLRASDDEEAMMTEFDIGLNAFLDDDFKTSITTFLSKSSNSKL